MDNEYKRSKIHLTQLNLSKAHLTYPIITFQNSPNLPNFKNWKLTLPNPTTNLT